MLVHAFHLALVNLLEFVVLVTDDAHVFVLLLVLLPELHAVVLCILVIYIFGIVHDIIYVFAKLSDLISAALVVLSLSFIFF